jgi:hypothetical protein
MPMLDWLKSLCWWIPKQNRVVFRYWDGIQWRLGDPFALWRAILHHPVMNLSTMAAMLDRGEEPESTIVLDGLAEVFGLTRLDDRTGRGLTDWEVQNTFIAFENYISELKKSTDAGPMPSEPTDLPSSTSTEPQEELASVSLP